MEKSSNERLYWIGRKMDSKLLDKGLEDGSVVRLNTTFRIPAKVMEHIKNNHVIPTTDFPKPMEMQGIGVQRTEITLNGPNQLESLSRDILGGKLCDILLLQGIHPGHCAVLYTEDMEDALFPEAEGGREEFVRLLNEEMKWRMMNPKYAPQVSEDMDESIFYSQNQSLQTDRAVFQPNTPLVGVGSTDPWDTVQYHFDNHSEVMYCTVIYCTVL